MESNPSEIARCADFIQEYLDGCGAVHHREDRDGTPSISVLPEEDFAPVLLMSHIDVVEGPEEMFAPRVEDGKLYGRGSIDDKYAVALSLVLLKRHLRKLRARGKNQRDLPFGILITGDEEVGGYNGAKQALEEIRANFCIALDGGDVEKIVVKEKGILTLRLVSRGRAAHGARPWQGENAIEKLIDDWMKIRTFFTAAAADHWSRTVNFSVIRAGKSQNQVPERAEAILDIRYTEHDDVDALLSRMRGEISGELLVERREPLFIGGDSPYLDKLLSLAPEAGLDFEHGASDARFLAERGIQGVVWGADGDLSAHAPDEHINLESFQRLYEIMDRFLEESRSVS
ncbi:MAG: M20 family metallopeptidase [Desulfobacterales bacterium]|nr:M20 family metallopeptidase [Desulfobacterales bacterium]